MLRLHDESNNDITATSDSSAASPLNGPTNDDGGTAVGGSNDQTSDFKDANAGKEDNLEREVFVRFSPEGLCDITKSAYLF